MGTHSVFNRPENHIGYARALTDKSSPRQKSYVTIWPGTHSPFWKRWPRPWGDDLIHFQRSVIDAKAPIIAFRMSLRRLPVLRRPRAFINASGWN